MKPVLRRRPSPALLIALVALFVSLGGVSYGVATGSIDSREIKDNTIRSRDIRNNTVRSIDIRNNEVRGRDIRNSTISGRKVALNTLTGADINESTLGKVPQAARADTAMAASTAVTATSIGGLSLRKLFAKQATGTAAVEILRGEGFTVRAGCSGVGGISLQIDGLPGGPATNVTVEGGQSTGDIFESDPDLQPGDNIDLLGGGQGGAGTAVVATSAGNVTTILYGAQDANAFAGEAVCAVRGTVVAG
jgi:hypothetical protein